MDIDKASPLSCPKCGNTSGWTGPRFRAATQLRGERLGFVCIRCNYERLEHTVESTVAEAKEPTLDKAEEAKPVEAPKNWQDKVKGYWLS